MPQLPSLPEQAHLRHLFEAFPGTSGPLMAYTDALLRGEGALPIAERELIAAYVSGLNACKFCFGSHKIYAEAFGIAGGVIEAVLADPDTAPVSAEMKAILTYLRKLNTLPATLVQADLDAVLAAGVSEAALVEAVQIAGLFNMMNRIIEGTGVSFEYAPDDDSHPARKLGDRVAEHSYGGTPMGGRR